MIEPFNDLGRDRFDPGVLRATIFNARERNFRYTGGFSASRRILPHLYSKRDARTATTLQLPPGCGRSTRLRGGLIFTQRPVLRSGHGSLYVAVLVAYSIP
jgi:hypothetical protein